MIANTSTPAGRRRADDDCAAAVEGDFRHLPILDTELGAAARLDGARAVVAVDKGNCDVAIGGCTCSPTSVGRAHSTTGSATPGLIAGARTLRGADRSGA
jgi:hypothetical protein